MDLKDKKVLLIMPKYFGYEKAVGKALENYGLKVYSIYENITELSIFYNVIYYHFKKLIKTSFENYYLENLKKVPKDIDYVLVIRGWSLSKDIIKMMKDKFKRETEYIYWQWDSVKNNPNSLEISECFNKVLTFDNLDAQKYGWTYRPNFFVDDYIEKKKEKSIDVLYIGSLHSRRYEILKLMQDFCEHNKLLLKSLLFTKRSNFYKLKYINKERINKSDFTFKYLDLNETYKLYSQSKVVVEYVSPNQSGLTMRALDCLANECKLITNNKNIKSADFYNKNNILVYEDSFDINPEFIQTPYIKIDNDIVNKYSIYKWLIDVFR